MAPMTPQNMSGSFLQSSFVLEETPNHNVEAFGTTLPVTVAEILTMSESILSSFFILLEEQL